MTETKKPHATAISTCQWCGLKMGQPATFTPVPQCVCDYAANPKVFAEARLQEIIERGKRR